MIHILDDDIYERSRIYHSMRFPALAITYSLHIYFACFEGLRTSKHTLHHKGFTAIFNVRWSSRAVQEQTGVARSCVVL